MNCLACDKETDLNDVKTWVESGIGIANFTCAACAEKWRQKNPILFELAKAGTFKNGAKKPKDK